MTTWNDRAPRGLLGILSASFRLGRAFDVEVRVYALTLVVFPLFAAIEWGRVGYHGSELVFDVAAMTLALYLVVWTHEMGHILAARRYGVITPEISLSPLGGLAHLSSGVPSPRSDVVVSLMGPATHLLWLLPLWPLSRWVVDAHWLRPEGWSVGVPAFLVSFLWQVNIGLLLFNLLPIFPLDGGRVLRAVLSMRLQPNRATLWATRIGTVGGAGMIVYGLFFEQSLFATILVVIGIGVVISCRQEARAARHHVGPYEAEPRLPWESDPDAWKRAAAAARRPSGLARWRAARRARAEARRCEADAALAEAVDRVLDRVKQVGMAGLNASERRVLERASRRQRGG